MLAHIHAFANLLRGAGIRVSTDELSSALTGTSHIDIASRDELKNLLKTTLIKKSSDLALFESLFALHFSLFAIPEESLSSPLATNPIIEKALEDALAEDDHDFSSSFIDFIREGLRAPLSMLVDTQQEIPWDEFRYFTQTGRYLQKVRDALQMNDWDTQTRNLLSSLADRGMTAREVGVVETHITGQTSQLEGLIREHVDGQAKARLQSKRRSPSSRQRLKRPFSILSPQEIAAMQQTIREMAQKMRDELGLRWKRSQRGRFDLKGTLRKSLANGGVPTVISMRKHARSKTRIVVLCDVSSSVRNASRFMLHLLYELQEQFGKVQSFIFVDQIVETTALFEKYDVQRAVETALNHDELPFDRYTCYGDVFKQFSEEHAESLNRRTSLMIIGDARNNLLDTGEKYFERLRSRARRVFWLNPEASRLWDSGDSVMYVYRRHCDVVREVRNLNQLIDFVNTFRA